MIWALIPAALGRFTRSISPRGWYALAAVVGLLVLLAYCTTQARQDERAKAERQHAEAYARQLERQASANDKASARRLDDLTTNIDLTKERDDDARSQPDGVPDDRELRRRCRQLRDAGSRPAACRRFDG